MQESPAAPQDPGPREPFRRPSRRARIVFAAVFGLALAYGFAWIWNRGVALRPDSRSYLEGYVHRTAGYPLLVAAVRAIAGKWNLQALVGIQAVLGLGAAAALALHLRRRFRLGALVTFVLLAVLLEPYRSELVGNRILSQALAYPLFLLALRFLVAGLIDRRDRDLIAYLALTSATVLTRPQFLFLHVVSTLAVAWVVARRRPLARNALLVGALLASFVAAPLADRTWRWARHGAFAGVPYTGHQLIAGALYHSRAEDAELFAGKTRELFVHMRERALEKKALAPAQPKLRHWPLFFDLGFQLYDVRHFAGVYNDLAWETAYEKAVELYCPGCELADQFIAVDPPLKEIAFRSMRARPGVHLRFYLSNFAAAATPQEWFVLLLAAVAALAAGLVRERPAGLALGAGVLCHLGNLGLTALVEPVLDRYAFPTQAPYLALLAVFVAVAVTGLGRGGSHLDAPAAG